MDNLKQVIRELEPSTLMQSNYEQVIHQWFTDLE